MRFFGFLFVGLLALSACGKGKPAQAPATSAPEATESELFVDETDPDVAACIDRCASSESAPYQDIAAQWPTMATEDRQFECQPDCMHADIDAMAEEAGME